jgi:HAE1 family hydrophobic/amphiphilic exporter-1
MDAARDGTAEIGLAVMATTFTIVAVFIPVAFMGGMVGRMFYEFGITVAAAVLVSLFVSFTLDPMLSSRWVDPDIERGHHPHWVGRKLATFNRWFDDLHFRYERLLAWCLENRLKVLGVAGLAFVAGILIIPTLGADFMPDFNRGEYQIAFKATPGTTLRETGERAREMVRRLKAMPEVEYTYTTIGESGGFYRPVTDGATYVKLRDSKGGSFSAVLAKARQVVGSVPGLTTSLIEAGMFQEKPIQVSVRGGDIDQLDRLSQALMREMGSIRGLVEARLQACAFLPEVNEIFSELLGLDFAAIAAAPTSC